MHNIDVCIFIYFPITSILGFIDLIKLLKSSWVKVNSDFLFSMAHWLHPHPLSKALGIAFHTCPHILHLHFIFVLFPLYLPSISILGFILFISSINCSCVFLLLIWLQLGHPYPSNKWCALGLHSWPHILHLQSILVFAFTYFPIISILGFMSFINSTNSSCVLLFAII